MAGARTVGVLFPKPIKIEKPSIGGAWRKVGMSFRKVGDNMRKAIAYEEMRRDDSED